MRKISRRKKRRIFLLQTNLCLNDVTLTLFILMVHHFSSILCFLPINNLGFSNIIRKAKIKPGAQLHRTRNINNRIWHPFHSGLPLSQNSFTVDNTFDASLELANKKKLGSTSLNKYDLKLLILDNHDSYTYNLYSYLSTICVNPPIVVTNDAYKSWGDLLKGLNLTTEENALDGIIISPGPGRPETARDIGICMEAIGLNSNVPILGVCLGHQALGHYYNANVTLAPCGPVHGLTSPVQYINDQKGHIVRNDNHLKGGTKMLSEKRLVECNLFHGIPQLFDVVRYHSLVVQFPGSVVCDEFTNDNHLEIEPMAWCEHNSSLDPSEDNVGNHETINHDKICMALRHKEYPHYGVQFHPESIGTGEAGYKILENFCDFCHKWSVLETSSDEDISRTKVQHDSTIDYAVMKERDDVKDKQSMHLLTDVTADSEDILPKKNQRYEVLVSKLSATSFLKRTPSPEEVYTEIYSSLGSSFWLDSSTGAKDALKSGGSKENESCPILSNSRFSIIGGSDGPLFKEIEYFGKEKVKDKQGLFIVQNSSDGQKKICVEKNGDILTYLNNQMRKDGTIESVQLVPHGKSQDTKRKLDALNNDKCTSIWNTVEDKKLEVQTLSENLSALPFDFRGGYVGYLGYEARFITQKTYNLDGSEDDEKNANKQSQKDCNVPTSAFLFADQCLVYDHWSEDWYVIGVTLNDAGNKGIHDNTDKVKLQRTKLWMREIINKIYSMDSVGESTNEIFPIIEPFVETLSKSVKFSMRRDKKQYISDIATCLDKIRLGESYEICLTNQLQANVSFPKQGTKASTLMKTPFGLYRSLRKINPAPFGAFFHFNGVDAVKMGKSNRENAFQKDPFYICCSSPERFMSVKRSFDKVSKDNDDLKQLYVVESKPIKGTCARKIHTEGMNDLEIKRKEDAMVAQELQLSRKNRAENLMIVDLLRNDLSRVCQPGSVHVPKLMEIESFATVHQLVSTIRGTLDPENYQAVDVITACFPGGSMTGAPKLRTVEILNELELGNSRGPYSGCLGYFSLNGAMDMNILIRSAVVTPNMSKIRTIKNKSESGNSSSIDWKINIGSGGAITALSDCEDEFDEMILKIKPVQAAVQEWCRHGRC